MIMIFLLFCWSVLQCLTLASTQNIRVGVIGGGISGTTVSLFLKQEFRNIQEQFPNDTLSITLYEKDSRVGGRIRSLYWNEEKHFELGASIFHDSNHYIKSIAKGLGLTVESPSRTNSHFGLYNGNSFTYQTSPSTLLTMMNFFWRLGLFDFLRLKSQVSRVAERFTRFYTIQQAQDTEEFIQASSKQSKTSRGKGFETVRELLEAVDLFNLTQQTAESFLIDSAQLSSSSPLLRELVASAVRVNYNQPLTVNALAGAVGIIPLTQPQLFAVAEGNQRIPQLLANRFVDDLRLNHLVQRIVRGEDGTVTVEGVHGPDAEVFADQFDFVIIAAPLEFSEIDFLNYERESSQQLKAHHRQYKHTVATFVEGRLNTSYFALSSEDILPATLLTFNTLPANPKDPDRDSTGFSSIGSYWRNPSLNTTVYKVFSHQPLTNAQLSSIFWDIQPKAANSLETHDRDLFTDKVVSKDWLAYPRFSGREKFGSFIPFKDRTVFYVSAFENAISCAECMAVAAKNVALLVSKEVRTHLPKTEENAYSPSDAEVEKNLHVEL